jgi:DNA-binding Xre family transcriptional regulator
MSYQKVKNFAHLISPEGLEKAMMNRNLGGRELALLARTSDETISRLRHGRKKTCEETARAIEKALRCQRGELFTYRSLSGDEK